MRTLESQLADYGQLHDELFEPISIDEITTQTLGVERPTRRNFSKNPTALALAAMVAVLLVIGGIAFLMGGTSEPEPVDRPTTTVRLPAALRQNGEVITHPGDPRAGGDLVAQDPTTGEIRTLVPAETLGDSLVGRAAWSADGRWAAYEILACGGGSTDEAGTGGLWVTNGVDEPRQLTKPCFEDGPADIYAESWDWSPTGAQLVVARQFSNGDSLVLIDPATGDRTDLGKAGGDVTSLAWSPDGTRIAYGAVPTGTRDVFSEPGSLHSVSVDGRTHRLLASVLGTVAGNDSGSGIRWSPDSGRIAVLTEAEETMLYLVDADGSDLELVTVGVTIDDIMATPGFVWSPDGTRMAYGTTSGGRRGEIQFWNGSPDGSTPILLFDSAPERIGDSFSGGLVWSPDGAQVAFRYQNGWLVTNADGTGDAREIDELQYLSWRGGWYFCECYG